MPIQVIPSNIQAQGARDPISIIKASGTLSSVASKAGPRMTLLLGFIFMRRHYPIGGAAVLMFSANICLIVPI